MQEMHWNQHGLLLLSGQGIYRLGSDWCTHTPRTQIKLGQHLHQLV